MSERPGSQRVARAADEVVRQFFARAFNGGDHSAVQELIAPDHRNDDPTAPEVPPGPEGVHKLVELYRDAFPDLRFEHGEMFCAGDLVAHSWTFTGTHQGEIMGIAPTGRRVRVRGLEINRVVDGQIVESHAISDALGLLRQLGVDLPG